MAILRILSALALLAQSASAALQVDLDSTGEFSQSLSLSKTWPTDRSIDSNEAFSVTEVDLVGIEIPGFA